MGGVLSAILSWLWGGQRERYPALGDNADEPNETTGVTPRQAREVLKTWDLVRPDAKMHGINIFIRLFKEFPNAQAKFRSFKDVDPDSLTDNKRLAAHASTVMTAIGNIVDNLCDPPTLVEILKTTGRNHKARGVEPEQFEDVKSCILGYLSENLGNAWTPLASAGWEKSLSAVNAVILTAYKSEDSD